MWYYHGYGAAETLELENASGTRERHKIALREKSEDAEWGGIYIHNPTGEKDPSPSQRKQMVPDSDDSAGAFKQPRIVDRHDDNMPQVFNEHWLKEPIVIRNWMTEEDSNRFSQEELMKLDAPNVHVWQYGFQPGEHEAGEVENVRLHHVTEAYMSIQDYFDDAKRRETFPVPVRGEEWMIKQKWDPKHPASFSCHELPSLFEKYTRYPVNVPGLENFEHDIPTLRVQIPYFAFPFHFDCMENFLIQVRGTKTIRYLFINDPEVQINQNAFEFYDAKELFNSTTQAGPWKGHMYEYTMEPGDALYLPVMWMHAVEVPHQEHLSIFVNFSLVPKSPSRRMRTGLQTCARRFARQYPKRQTEVNEKIEYEKCT